MIGKTIRNYRIVSELGKGGMGIVYLAEHINLPRRFVVKSLAPALTQDPKFLERFYQEAQNQAMLAHPAIVQATDYFEDSGEFFLVMEYVDGQALDAMISTRGPLPEQEALSIVRDVLEGLGFAHRKRVIHRDVKPSNILVDQSGKARITDFGIAILAGSQRFTATGLTVGTAWYMSPEQIRQPRSIDQRSDIYSAGIVLYEMLTGAVPFDGDTDFSVKEQQINKAPPDPRTRNPAISSTLAQIVQRAMAKDPAIRYQTCSEFLAEILDYERKRNSNRTPPFSEMLSAATRSIFKRIRQYAQQDSKGPEQVAKSTGHTSTNTEFEPALPENRRSRGPTEPRQHGPKDATNIFLSASSSDTLPRIKVALMIIKCTDPSLLGKRITLSDYPFHIGREHGDYRFPDDFGISSKHLILDYRAGQFTVRDVGSTNGTYINGRLLKPEKQEPMFLGDNIRLSNHTTVTFVPDEWRKLPDLTGQVIDDRFRLLKLRSSSLKAAVYLAEDQKFPRKVALKLLSPQLAAFPTYMDQFKREAEAAEHLCHEYICSVIEFGSAKIKETSDETMELPYLCMKLMDGGNIEDQLAGGTPVPLEKVVVWVEKISDALNYAHNEGTIHGGLKPSAVVFNKAGSPFVTDFASSPHPAGSSGISVIGAPAYLAPEQWEGFAPTIASDQYSLAVLTYYLVTGTQPYAGQEDPDFRKRNYERGPVLAHVEAERNAITGVPIGVSNVLSRAMAIKSEERYPSIRDFASALAIAASRQNLSLMDEPRIFISYHRATSAAWVHSFEIVLKQKYGITSYYDSRDQEAAGRFPERLHHEIKRCDVFVCFLAEHTLESKWVQEEIGLACKYDKPLVPVFQESFNHSTPSEELEPNIDKLLTYEGVPLLDRRNAYVDEAIAKLARLVKRTLEETQRVVDKI